MDNTRSEKMLLFEERQQKRCCINPPLLNIPLDHIILDELYLLIRITDVLLHNGFDEVIKWDIEEAHKKKVSKPAHTESNPGNK